MRRPNPPPEHGLNKFQWSLGIVQAILAAVGLALTLAELGTMVTVLQTTHRRGHFDGTLPYFLVTHALALAVSGVIAVGGAHYRRLSQAEQYTLTYCPTHLPRNTKEGGSLLKLSTKPSHDEIAWHTNHATASRLTSHGLWQGGLKRCAQGFQPHVCLGVQLPLFGMLVGATAVFNTSTTMLGATCSQFQSKWWLFSLCHMDRLSGVLMMLECAVWASAVGVAVGRVVQQSRAATGQVTWCHFYRPTMPQSDHALESQGSVPSTPASTSPTLYDAGLETMSNARSTMAVEPAVQDQVQWLTPVAAAEQKCPQAQSSSGHKAMLPTDSGDESDDEGTQICSLKDQTVRIDSSVQRVRSVQTARAKVTTARDLGRSASQRVL